MTTHQGSGAGQAIEVSDIWYVIVPSYTHAHDTYRMASFSPRLYPILQSHARTFHRYLRPTMLFAGPFRRTCSVARARPDFCMIFCGLAGRTLRLRRVPQEASRRKSWR